MKARLLAHRKAFLACGLLLLGLACCAPEKSLNPDGATVPIVCLDEDLQLIWHDNAIFLRVADGAEARVFGPDKRLSAGYLAQACVRQDRLTIELERLQWNYPQRVITFSMAGLRNGGTALSGKVETLGQKSSTNPADCTLGGTRVSMSIMAPFGPLGGQPVKLSEFNSGPSGINTVFASDLTDGSLIDMRWLEPFLTFRKGDVQRRINLPIVPQNQTIPLV